MFLNMLNVLEISLISVFGDSIDRVTDLISMFPSQWFAPVCIDRHWWLYAFEIYQKRLWVLDSMYIGEPSNERLKIHAYAGRIIEDMAKVTMPAYEHTKDGLPRFYPSVPRQDNGCDCGVFVIKFMQFWSLDKPLQHWDKVKTLYRSLGRRSY
ncbi:putative ubiquitin-like-specific protease 1B isoform X1 [Arachis ipaensis]|uniref:putative ubiquitin-like-specific protease 1B isoform X1 n=1 Tax=Arachis ipaensis TaxID=130454 RepID=UPI000A2B56DC|nr:putative ubiquitin-like-specific protease 1B isoform X1 [Arachis ipaensis]